MAHYPTGAQTNEAARRAFRAKARGSHIADAAAGAAARAMIAGRSRAALPGVSLTAMDRAG
jgi:hypothetical protein